MGANLLGIVFARTPPTIMIVLGFFGWIGESAINTIGITAIPVVVCALLIIGGVAIHLLELVLGV